MSHNLPWYEKIEPNVHAIKIEEKKQKLWLENQATPEQLKFFKDNGYLIVRNALSPEMVDRLVNVVDDIAGKVRAYKGLKEYKDVNTLRAVMEDPVMLELLTNSKAFPMMFDILGWNIQLYISQMIIKPPQPEEYRKKGMNFNGIGWHQDGGRPTGPNGELSFDHAVDDGDEKQRRVNEASHLQNTPMLTAKISYWLSDTTVPNCGAMMVIPGSHKSDFAPQGKLRKKDELARVRDYDTNPQGWIALKVKPGDAVIFERRIWHSTSNNYSDITRKVLMFGYSYRWLRGLDYNTMPESLLRHCSPIQRQLLGDCADIKGYWQPTKEDVPLKHWLDKHRDGKYGAQLHKFMSATANDRNTYKTWDRIGMGTTTTYRPAHSLVSNSKL